MSEAATIDQLRKRIEVLESVVFGQQEVRKSEASEYRGATGGLRFLVARGFFDKKRSFSETKAELEKNGYNYSRQAVQMPLTRLSNVGGLLVCLTEKGKNAYAKRK